MRSGKSKNRRDPTWEAGALTGDDKMKRDGICEAGNEN